MADLLELCHIVEKEYPIVVESAYITRGRVGVILHDKSFIDFWWSGKVKGNFSYSLE